MIIKTNDEMGSVVMGTNDIKVERVFVSLDLNFLNMNIKQHSLQMPIFSTVGYICREQFIYAASLSIHLWKHPYTFSESV